MLVNDINVDEAIKYSKILKNEEPEHNDCFSLYSPIYISPTPNVIEVAKLYEGAERILTVGSLGAFPYEYALNGAKRIDCFDKNALQGLYFELIKATIKNCEYETLISNFSSIGLPDDTQDINSFLSSDLFYDVLEHVEEPARKYWAWVFMKNDVKKLLYTNLFRSVYALPAEKVKRIASMYNEESFYKLKELLNNNEVEINYHICDATEIDKEFEGKTYDLVAFDNIFQFYRSMGKYSNLDNIHNFLQNRVVPMLNDNGSIQVGYGFYIVAETIENFINKGMIDILCNYSLEEINLSIQHDFIPNMINRFDDYEINYVDAVENILHERPKTKNVVLSYRKK